MSNKLTVTSTEENLINIIIEFANFLRKNQFDISVENIISFFKLIPKINIFDYKEFQYTLKVLLCNNLYTFSVFDELLNKYMYIKFTPYIENMLAELKNMLEKEANEKLEQSIKRLENKIAEIKQQSDKFLEEIDKKFPLNNLSLSEKSLEFAQLKGKQILSLELQKASDIVKKIQKDDGYVEKHKGKLSKFLLTNLSNDNFEDINKMVFEQLDKLNGIDKALKNQKELELNFEEKTKKSLENTKKSIEKEQSKKFNELSIKYGVTNHKKEFIGKSSVIDLLKQKDKTIERLSESEYISLVYYIKLNASKFRTKISLSMKHSKNKVIDMKKTVQQGFKYDGIPIKLYYKKPIVKKYKLFCMFDISGSVSKYLDILIPFIMELNIVFNGGIQIYGFVNSIMNFTEVFKQNSINELLRQIKGHRGYSNYYKSLEEFYNLAYSNMNKDSIVIYFGDARNNTNESGIEFISQIKNKVKYSIWLNPEEFEKWNTYDSIIFEYSKCVNKVYEINTVGQLINFLNDFSITNSLK